MNPCASDATDREGLRTSLGMGELHEEMSKHRTESRLSTAVASSIDTDIM